MITQKVLLRILWDSDVVAEKISLTRVKFTKLSGRFLQILTISELYRCGILEWIIFKLFVCFLSLFRKSPLISSQDFYPSAEVYLSALSRLVLTTLAIVIWIASLQDTQFAYIPNELANTISPYFQVSVKQIRLKSLNA